MSEKYSLEEITKAYKWLGHKQYTDLSALHPDYRPGQFEWNRENRVFPITSYAKSSKDVLDFVKKYSPERLVLYGINPRPMIYKNDKGYFRSALEHEIEICQNMYIDIDPQSKNFSKEQIAKLELSLEKFDQFFLDQGLLAPVNAFTGRGYHKLLAFPPIKVSECPDMAQRQKLFAEQFQQAFKRELEDLEVKIDQTFDLVRKAKIYGTAKPKIGVISKFYGNERKEDEALKNCLINLKIPEAGLEGKLLNLGHDLPPWFKSLLIRDSKLQSLWSGEGKTEGQDSSRSGYDFSVVKSLLGMGYKNIDELGTILALRPNGGVKGSGKGEQYLRHTIANALLK